MFTHLLPITLPFFYSHFRKCIFILQLYHQSTGSMDGNELVNNIIRILFTVALFILLLPYGNLNKKVKSSISEGKLMNKAKLHINHIVLINYCSVDASLITLLFPLTETETWAKSYPSAAVFPYNYTFCFEVGRNFRMTTWSSLTE